MKVCIGVFATIILTMALASMSFSDRAGAAAGSYGAIAGISGPGQSGFTKRQAAPG